MLDLTIRLDIVRLFTFRSILIIASGVYIFIELIAFSENILKCSQGELIFSSFTKFMFVPSGLHVPFDTGFKSIKLKYLFLIFDTWNKSRKKNRLFSFPIKSNLIVFISVELVLRYFVTVGCRWTKFLYRSYILHEMKLHFEEFHELYFRCLLLGRQNEGDVCHM